MSDKNNEPAFPRTGSYSPEGQSCYDSTSQVGMTKRELMAMHLMAAMCSDHMMFAASVKAAQDAMHSPGKELAANAVTLDDSLLEELAK